MQDKKNIVFGNKILKIKSSKAMMVLNIIICCNT